MAAANPSHISPATYYVDSSVLVKRHVQETGSNWFRQIANPNTGNAIITSRLSITEVFSAFNRRVREAQLNASDYAVIAADFEAVVIHEYEIIPLGGIVTEQTRQLLEAHPLRAGDAVQLASAIVTNERLRIAHLPPSIFIAADDRLLVAARAQMLQVEDARSHP